MPPDASPTPGVGQPERRNDAAALENEMGRQNAEKWAIQEAAATHFTLDMLAAAVAGGLTQTAVAPIER